MRYSAIINRVTIGNCPKYTNWIWRAKDMIITAMLDSKNQLYISENKSPMKWLKNENKISLNFIITIL